MDSSFAMSKTVVPHCPHFANKEKFEPMTKAWLTETNRKQGCRQIVVAGTPRLTYHHKQCCNEVGWMETLKFRERKFFDGKKKYFWLGGDGAAVVASAISGCPTQKRDEAITPNNQIQWRETKWKEGKENPRRCWQQCLSRRLRHLYRNTLLRSGGRLRISDVAWILSIKLEVLMK